MQNNIATFDKNKFTPYSIGFDSLFDKLFEMDDHNSNSYPPYNIFKKDENNYTIEMALAGFNKSNIDIEVISGELTIKSKNKTETDDFRMLWIMNKFLIYLIYMYFNFANI